MSMRYGSLHIVCGKNTEIVEKVMSVYQNNINSIYNKLQALMGDIIDISAISNTIFLVLHDGFLTIFDENLNFESIQKEASKLSRELNLNVIYTSNFGYDIFVAGLVNNGKEVTSFCCGENLTEFSMQKSAIDMGLIRDILNIDGATDINLLTDIEEIEDTIGYEWLKMPTFYDEDYINDKFDVKEKNSSYVVLFPKNKDSEIGQDR